MNGHTPDVQANGQPHRDASTHFDLLIIGFGISGINTSYRIKSALPETKYAVLEARTELGGTWSLFDFPGIRSDTDLYTYGFAFNPWKASNSIATGESIKTYLRSTVDQFGLEKYVRYRHKVIEADWRSEEQRWRVEVDITSDNGTVTERVVYWTKWLISGAGYYNYVKPMEADIPGLESFQGTRVHPQFWPKNLDYKDKKVIVIGSGATAITLLPALVEGGVSQVIQLQRSPSYILSVPQTQPEDLAWWERWIPAWLIYAWKRFVNIIAPAILYYFCIYFPKIGASLIHSEIKRQLPAGFPMDPHFKPAYKPWQQRMCLCPDGDYFKCFHTGRAKVVTDTIRSVVADGIELSSGDKLSADIIVTATGLNLQFLGGTNVRVDGKEVDISKEFLLRSAMITSLPNFGNIQGYWNGPWTLAADVSAFFFVRLMKHMRAHGYTSVVPVISERDRNKEIPTSPLNSTYIKRSANCMPRSASRGPWKPRSHYLLDRWRGEMSNLNDGLKFETVST